MPTEMTQASIETLFDVETAVETAAMEALAALGLSNLFKPSAEQLRREDVRAEIVFAVEGQPTHMAIVEGRPVRDMWRGTLTLQAVATEEAELRGLRAQLRYGLRDWFTALNAGLEWHEVATCEPVGDARVLQWDEGIVSVALRFSVMVGIKPGSWAGVLEAEA